ncbi:lamin tail domain-containing protein [Candidatus Dojkabacteria bacterium]|nr:lamin tail domain-containing protein [Candidatus Dojkabacteria bacterium]
MKLKVFFIPVAFFIFSNTTLAANDLIITEVLPNPIGDDKSGEFIELYNPTDSEVNINDYFIDTYQINNYIGETFQTLSSKEFLIIHDDEIDLKTRFPGEYKRAVIDSLTSRGLSNTGDKIELTKEGLTIDTFEYINSLDGQSIVKPLPECIYQTNTNKIDLAIDNASIGKFDNIFNFADLGIGLEYYYQGEWVLTNTFSNITNLTYRLYSSNICSLTNSDFQISNTSMPLESSNILVISGNDLINANIELIHIPTLSEKTFNLKIDNRVSPTPTITLQPEPSTTPLPSPNPTLIPTPIPTITISPTPQPTATPIANNSINYKLVRINEIYPSPNTGETEWLEIFNYGNEEVNLENFVLKDETGIHTISNTKLAANSYFVIEDPDLKVSLNNTGDLIKLFNPNGELVSELIYTSTDKGVSNIIYNAQIVKTNTPTKGTINIVTTQVAIEDPIKEPIADENTVGIDNPISKTYSKIRISAVYPTPLKGEQEWIELSNYGGENYILNNWKLTDKNSSQTIYNIEILANSAIKLTGKDLKITLNNSGEEISLFDPNGLLISKIVYPKTTNGTIFNQNISISPDSTSENQKDIDEPLPDNVKETQTSNKTEKNHANQIKKIVFGKLPKKYEVQLSKIDNPITTIPKEDPQPKIIKDTGILLLSLAGFTKTDIGKELIKMFFNKLEGLGS